MKNLSKKNLMVFMLMFSLTSINYAQKKFEINDLSKITNLADPQISPDGKFVSLVVSTPYYDQNRFNTELVIVDIATGKRRALTSDRINLSQAKWSPSGEYISFLARTSSAKDAMVQLYLLPMNGGEAKQLTKVPKGVQHYSWNPAGTSIALATADEPANKEKIEKGYDAFEIGNNDMLVTTAVTPTHIWIIPVPGGDPKRMTSGTWSLPVTIPPGPPSSPLSWSADGKTIAFAKSISPYSGDGRQRSLQVLTVADGSIKPLTGRTRLETNPVFSPDGKSIAYWYRRNGEGDNVVDVWITSPAGGEGKNISMKIDRDIYRTVWFADNKNLLVSGNDDNKNCLWVVSIDGSSKKVNLGALSANGFFWTDCAVSKDGGIAFTATSPNQAPELYYMADASAAAKKLTDFNAAFHEFSFAKVETLRWSHDGLEHNGIVTYPLDYSPGKKYPLVLNVHGGPAAASLEAFSFMSQVLAAKGYFVLQPNFRGSDNLGSKYKMANTGNWGPGPGSDIMAGVAKLTSSGMIDTARMAVSGWSYGGYMTAWLASKYNVWKAAVAGAPVVDLRDQYNLSDGNVILGERFGSPYKDKDAKTYEEQSPITYVNNIKAPTLILANTLDPRVLVVNSYKLYHGLKDNGITTRFIGWPVPLHNANDPVRQRETMKYWIEWIDQYLNDTNQTKATTER